MSVMARSHGEQSGLSCMNGKLAAYDEPAESSTTVFRGGPATNRFTIEMRNKGRTSSEGPAYV